MSWQDEILKMNLKNKIKISKLRKTFIRDRWGNLSNCFWNEMIKKEIIKLETK